MCSWMCHCYIWCCPVPDNQAGLLLLRPHNRCSSGRTETLMGRDRTLQAMRTTSTARRAPLVDAVDRAGWHPGAPWDSVSATTDLAVLDAAREQMPLDCCSNQPTGTSARLNESCALLLYMALVVVD